MDFFETVKIRRSVRKYLPDVSVPDEVVEKALDAAILAPNSSNMQTWEFYWVQSSEKKSKLIEACLNQNAARSSKHLVVVVANISNWKRSQKEILRIATKDGTEKPNPIVFKYYSTIIPLNYAYHFFAPIKWLIFNLMGLFKPFARHPWSKRDAQEVSIKSASLAAENFMLAVSAQDFDTCPMEGFDECRVKKILGISNWKNWNARVVMVISVGKRDPNGLWGSQMRFDKNWVVKKI